MLNSNELINKVKNYNKFLNPEKLDKAYNFAVKAHKSQKRASGDPYSVHPCLLYTSPSQRDRTRSRMPSSA